VSEQQTESTVVEAEPARRVSGTQPISRADRARRTAYRSRFAAVYIALAAVVGIAVGSFIVLAGRDSPPPAPPWSSWQPTGSTSARLNQIAYRVSREYKLPSGKKLITPIVTPPQVTSPGQSGNAPLTFPVSAIAVRPDTSRGEEGDVDFVSADNGVMFELCGDGQSCSISEGQPSDERHALLRREALELSLYAFKYVKGLDNVTVFLPPRPDGQADPTAVFLTKADVERQLGVPLSRTLASTTPAIGAIPQHERDTIDAITLPRLYTYEPTLAQNGSAILVLTPIPLGA
jgi:hypothetical protein